MKGQASHLKSILEEDNERRTFHEPPLNTPRVYLSLAIKQNRPLLTAIIGNVKVGIVH